MTLANVVPPKPLTLVVVNIVYGVDDEGTKLPPASTFTVPPVNGGAAGNGELVVLTRGIGVDPEDRAGLETDIAENVQGAERNRRAGRDRTAVRHRNYRR